jgi:hypothetical protein
MKSIVYSLLFLSSINFTPVVHAGDRVGHGADAIGAGQGKYTLLDLAEESDRYFDPRSILRKIEHQRNDVDNPGDTWSLVGSGGSYPGSIDASVSKSASDFSDIRWYVESNGLLRIYTDGNRPIGGPTVVEALAFTEFFRRALGISQWHPYFDLGEAKNWSWALAKPVALVWKFTDTPLEEIEDEGVVHLFQDQEQKVQLAVQKDGVVLVHEPTFNQLDDWSKVGMVTHEALIYIQLVGNPRELTTVGTANIRRFNRLLLDQAKADARRKLSGIPKSAFQNAYSALRLPKLGGMTKEK